MENRPRPKRSQTSESEMCVMQLDSKPVEKRRKENNLNYDENSEQNSSSNNLIVTYFKNSETSSAYAYITANSPFSSSASSDTFSYSPRDISDSADSEHINAKPYGSELNKTKENQIITHVCKLCNYSTTSDAKIANHNKQCSIVHIQEVSKYKTQVAVKNFLDHIKIPVYCCEQCQYVATNMTELELHRIHFPNHLMKVMKYKCQKCRFVSGTERELQEHSASHALNKSPRKLRDNLESKPAAIVAPTSLVDVPFPDVTLKEEENFEFNMLSVPSIINIKYESEESSTIHSTLENLVPSSISVTLANLKEETVTEDEN